MFSDLRIAVKTGLAAAVAFSLDNVITAVLGIAPSIASGLWPTLSAIVVMQAHLGATYMSGFWRLTGTLLGSVIAALFCAAIAPGVISLALAITSAVMLCSLLKIKEGMRIACLTVAIIIILWKGQPELVPWSFASLRFLESCLGIAVAVVISHLLWPKHAAKEVMQHIADIFDKIEDLYLNLAVWEGSFASDDQLKEHTAAVENLFNLNDTFLQECRYELRTQFSLEKLSREMEKLDELYEAVMLLKDLDKKLITQIWDDDLEKAVINVITATSTTMSSLSKAIVQNDNADSSGRLKESLATLNEQMLRFRQTKITRQFNLEEIEAFFVYLYALRSIAQHVDKLRFGVATTRLTAPVRRS